MKSLTVMLLTASINFALLPQAAHASETDFNRLRQQSIQAEDRGEIEKAMRLRQQMLQMKPDDIEALVALSGFYGIFEQPQKQLEICHRILKIKPNHVDALVNQGNAYAALDRIGDAQDSYRKAMKIEPLNPIPPYSLGVIEQSRDREQEAMQWFLAALKISPDFEDALFNLAVSHANLNQTAKAIEVLDRLLRKNPGAIEARKMRDSLRSRPLFKRLG